MKFFISHVTMPHLYGVDGEADAKELLEPWPTEITSKAMKKMREIRLKKGLTTVQPTNIFSQKGCR
jgi:hypothetical protein